MSTIPRAEEYDYYLIVWGPGDVHAPMPFQKGIDPVPYCEEMIRKGNEKRKSGDPHAPSFYSYRIFSMNCGKEHTAS